ncbi:MAG: hypothetical protein WCP85_09810 [Mariniphaga sp.]
MTQKIETRINELKEYVDKQRELIIGINNAIENEDFHPSISQQATLNYICQQGKWGLKEIEKLEELKKGYE